MEFNDRLKELRIQKKLTQQELADLLKVNRVTYRNYETGTNEPKFRTLLELGKIFNVTTDYLLGITDINEFDKSYEENIEKSFKEISDATNDYKNKLDNALYRLIKMVEYNSAPKDKIGKEINHIITIIKYKNIDIEPFAKNMIKQWSSFEEDRDYLLTLIGNNSETTDTK
ncbi:helix-turn-helix domain-containing protein [Streptococcus pluranimalium]|uniref:helix-turn-helix domain-containing protein n=1 Tax=Streptococcus TaxID=1301 RepID=UPI00036A12A5|nr:helix-turn-helix domain-containing protein [Streptococcus thoraltensis]